MVTGCARNTVCINYATALLQCILLGNERHVWVSNLPRVSVIAEQPWVKLMTSYWWVRCPVPLCRWLELLSIIVLHVHKLQTHTCVAAQVSSSSLASADRHSSSTWHNGLTSSSSGWPSLALSLANVWQSNAMQLSHLLAGSSDLSASLSTTNRQLLSKDSTRTHTGTSVWLQNIFCFGAGPWEFR